jgi:hypothetical protein
MNTPIDIAGNTLIIDKNYIATIKDTMELSEEQKITLANMMMSNTGREWIEKYKNELNSDIQFRINKPTYPA